MSWNFTYLNATDTRRVVSLFVRLWVEMIRQNTILLILCRQPLREAVSWNTKIVLEVENTESQPLREAVSWNTWNRYDVYWSSCSQPLREAVSWNKRLSGRWICCFKSASSWGCELKYQNCLRSRKYRKSASSWGCELKFHTKVRETPYIPSASSWGCELK